MYNSPMSVNDPLFQLIDIKENKSFQIADYQSTKRSLWDINNHYHDLYEIVLYKEISGFTYLNGRKEELVKDTILYLPPYCVHGFSDLSQASEYKVLHIPFNSIEKLPIYPMLLKIPEKQMDTLENLMDWAGDSGFSLQLKNQSIKLILLWIGELGCNSTVSYRGGNTLFKPLLKYLDLEREYTISASEAANLCLMSRSNFMDKFKKHFGTTFHCFITEKRISEAKFLLKNSEMNCTEIANQLSFSDSAHFSKIFKKVTGMKPKEYQKNNSI